MLNISERSISITKRFFEAIDALVETKRIRGLQTFTRSHDISFCLLSTLRNHKDKGVIKAEYIAYLCEDFDVSADWVLTGKGNMFNS